MQMLKRFLFLILVLGFNTAIYAEVFVVHKIKVTGLQRINLGTVLSYLPVREGDSIDSEQTADIIRALYQKTNFFSDVTLRYENNDLIIHVVERPVISFINTSGNNKITKQQLLDALKSVGIATGQALDPAVLHAMQNAIIQQYYNLGMYDPKVDVTVKSLTRNRVALDIKIHEGPTAKIKLIKIIGNKSFSEKKLLGELSLTTTKLWSFLTGSDQYSKEKLDVDLEKLRSYYMNHGFVHMRVDDAKVQITPDKKAIHIIITITEGAVYKLKSFTFEGGLTDKQQQVALKKQVTLKGGSIFSLEGVIAEQMKISEFLGNLGYGKADVRYDLAVNDHSHEVQVKYHVVPGHRIYIRHIDFSGNSKTHEEVLRREMRLQEGSLFSFSKLNESRRRLANLSYLQDIDQKLIPVTEANNQVDLLYNVKEVSAINFNLQLGYGTREGFVYMADMQDPNFLGTGKSLSLGFNNSRAKQYYGIGYRDPYFTQNNVGFGINGYFSKINPNKISSELSAYKTETYGISAGIDVPFSDYTQIDYGLAFEHISTSRSFNPNLVVEDFLDKYGTSFNQLKMSLGWHYSDLDKAIFPTSGFKQAITGAFYVPTDRHSLIFYKLEHTTGWYLPLFKDFILHPNTILGYGNGLGKTDRLPPFKEFRAGGIDSIRGFDADTLGNKSEDRNSITGGNLLALARFDLIIPFPMKDVVRPSIFYDVGGVYKGPFKVQDLRMSCGVQVEWRTPLVPLKFSLSKPLRKKGWDRLESFQFALGFTVF